MGFSRGGYSKFNSYGNDNRYGSSGGGSGHFNQSRGYNNSGSRNSPLKPVQWSSIELVEFGKNLYVEHPEIASMSPEEVQSVRSASDIRIVEGKRVPNPISSFSHSSLPKPILNRIAALGFEKPSPVQVQGWPLALSGRDLIAIAETGSGKTLGFLIPAMIHISSQPPLHHGDGPIALILAPTRELADQIRGECDKFRRESGIRVGVAYGGVPKRPQQTALRQGCELLVACPGRLIDFLEAGETNLHRVTYFVLDEADRMLDMGFEPQIRKVESQVRPDRQTLMWSATWPKEIQNLAHDFCKSEPVHINIGSSSLKACKNISQEVMIVNDCDKKQKLRQILQQIPHGEKTLIFVETKKGVDNLTREFRGEGIAALALHGDKKQEERNWVLSEFKQGRNYVLIATDVASRGLDVKDVRFVINYDFPNQIEDYVHRIGRTGRAGNFGQSFTFLTRDKIRLGRDLVKILRDSEQPIPSELEKLCSYGYQGTNSGFRQWEGSRRSNGPYSGNQYSRGSRGGYGRGGGGFGGSRHSGNDWAEEQRY